MKTRVLVIGFGLVLSAICLTGTPAWKTEHSDTMLVPPNAAHVTFLDRDSGEERLTYTVRDAYPASKFTHRLCELMEQKGWKKRAYGFCTMSDAWTKVHGGSGDEYHSVQEWDKWQNNELEEVGYTLDYTSSEDDHHLPQTLHVFTYAARQRVVMPLQPPVTVVPPQPDRKHDTLFRVGASVVYLVLLIALVPVVARASIRSAVFYGGPGGWLAAINLILFSPVLITFLSLGGLLMVAFFPGRENIPGAGVVVEAVGVWMILSVCSLVAWVAIPIVVVLAARMLMVGEISRGVKIAHGVIALLSVSFFIACIVFFSGPLIRW